MKKIRLKLYFVISILLIFSLTLVFIFFRSDNNIKLGMNKENTLLILDKHKYHYEINCNNDEPIIFVDDVILNSIEGKLYIHISSNNKVSHIVFSSSAEQLNEKIDMLNKYLTKLYGSSEYNDILSKTFDVEHYSFEKNNMIIVFEYPNNLNSNRKNISISWSYKNDNE